MCALGPLHLGGRGEACGPEPEPVSAPCLAPSCACVFQLPETQAQLLEHLFTEHRLVIADIERIAILHDYLLFWKEQFSGKDFAEYCTTMLVDTKFENTIEKDQKYFLLSDVLPIDNQLRRDLQQKRLEKILTQQKFEREDKTYERECLFCRTVIKGSRSDFLTHLFEKHNLYIAKLENLIFTSDLIEHLNDKLTNSICIYCEKTFKDRVILKEHMRKKAHKRINPNNSEYDKYFISNYLEIGRNWQSYMKNVNNKKKPESASSGSHVKSKNQDESSSDSDTNWSDWDEKDDLSIVCLFCKETKDNFCAVLEHMSNEHCFNFDSNTKLLNFYEKLKVVNYVRRQVYLNRCIECDEEFLNNENLISHMSDKKHVLITDASLWNRPEFYFSTYEDDSFLFFLEDNDDADENKITEMVKSTEEMHISQEVALSVIN